MSVYWSKACLTSQSAKACFELGDPGSAASRGYYAMHFAARAALLSEGSQRAVAKTHQTIIRRFGVHVATSSSLDRQLGRLLSRAYQDRNRADYGDALFGDADATRLLRHMDQFLLALAQHLNLPAP